MAELRESKWNFVTSGGFGGSADVGSFSLGVTRGFIRLTSPAGGMTDFKYYVGTGGVGLGTPIGLSYSAPEFFSAGKLYMLSAFHGTELRSSDIEGVCQIVEGSFAGFKGVSGSVMLLGMSLTDTVKDVVKGEFGPAAMVRRAVVGPADGAVRLAKTLWGLFHSDYSAFVADWRSAKALLVMKGVMLSFGVGVSRGIGILSVRDVVPEAPVDLPNPVGPPWAPTRSSAYETLELSADALFAFDKDFLTPEAALTLKQAGNKIKSQPGCFVVVKGHTDDVGGDFYNISLSNRRAMTVRNQLISDGSVDSSHVQAIGVGKKEPAVLKFDEAGRKRNRRVEIMIFARERSNFNPR